MDYVLTLRKANPLNEEGENARTFPRKIIIITSLTQIFSGVFAAILRVSTISYLLSIIGVGTYLLHEIRVYLGT